MCSSGGSYTTTETPSTPTASTSVKARSNEEALRKKAKGLSSTIVTSGLGLTDQATTSKPTLLGK